MAKTVIAGPKMSGTTAGCTRVRRSSVRASNSAGEARSASARVVAGVAALSSAMDGRRLQPPADIGMNGWGSTLQLVRPACYGWQRPAGPQPGEGRAGLSDCEHRYLRHRVRPSRPRAPARALGRGDRQRAVVGRAAHARLRSGLGRLERAAGALDLELDRVRPRSLRVLRAARPDGALPV